MKDLCDRVDPVFRLSFPLLLPFSFFLSWLCAPAITASENVPVKIPRPCQTYLETSRAVVNVVEEMDWQDRSYLLTERHRLRIFQAFVF